jgi:hypothetical protein
VGTLQTDTNLVAPDINTKTLIKIDVSVLVKGNLFLEGLFIRGKSKELSFNYLLSQNSLLLIDLV